MKNDAGSKSTQQPTTMFHIAPDGAHATKRTAWISEIGNNIERLCIEFVVESPSSHHYSVVVETNGNMLLLNGLIVVAMLFVQF